MSGHEAFLSEVIDMAAENVSEIEAENVLSPIEKMIVQDTLRIAQLEAQLETVLKMVEEQNALLSVSTEIVRTARAFVDVLSQQCLKTGEGAFKATHGIEDNDPIVETLNYRFSDLAAALNNAGRPVAPKLAQGTVH